MYLFVCLFWLHRVLVVALGIFVVARGIFRCGMWDLLVEACRIFSCGMWDLLPWPGIEPGPPALGARSLSHWTTREVPSLPSYCLLLVIMIIWGIIIIIICWEMRQCCRWLLRSYVITLNIYSFKYPKEGHPWWTHRPGAEPCGSKQELEHLFLCHLPHPLWHTMPSS